MNGWRLIAALLGSLGVALARGEAPADDAQQVFARVAPSVVTVRTFDSQGVDDGQGSGVVIARAQVVTNCHVVREAASLRVLAADKEFAAAWRRQDPARDICLLEVAGLTAPAVVLRRSQTVEAGETVFAVGNPLGLGLTVSRGLLAVKDVKGGQPVLAATAAVSPGSSGGGLFDREGRLLGITTAILGNGQNLNLILAADGLERLAADGKAPAQTPAPPAPDPRWSDEARALQKTEA